MSVLTITQNNFENEVLKSDKPVLLDFWASWCGPCRMLSPVVDEIAEENAQIKRVKLNVDEEDDIAASFGVISIHILTVMTTGQVVQHSVGVVVK